MTRTLDARLSRLEAETGRANGWELLSRLWGDLLRQRPELRECIASFQSARSMLADVEGGHGNT